MSSMLQALPTSKKTGRQAGRLFVGQLRTHSPLHAIPTVTDSAPQGAALHFMIQVSIAWILKACDLKSRGLVVDHQTCAAVGVGCGGSKAAHHPTEVSSRGLVVSSQLLRSWQLGGRGLARARWIRCTDTMMIMSWTCTTEEREQQAA